MNPVPNLGRELHKLAIHFAHQQALGQAVESSDQEMLADYTQFCARYMCYFQKLRTFTRLDSMPGYLRYELDQYVYFVPYNLAGMFPTDAQLKSITTLLASIRLSEASQCCFSGSSTFIGRLEAISDIDFCEYLVTAAGLPVAIEEKRKLSGHIQLVGVKYGNVEAYYPFAPSLFPDTEGAPSEAKPDTRIKLDFLSNASAFGNIAVTNVAILTDGTATDPALRLSFAFQEVMASKNTSALPKRRLDDAEELGRYMNWLRTEVVKHIAYAESNPDKLHYAIKALKRALSWFLVTGIEEEIADVLKHLQTKEMDEIAKMHRAAEVDNILRPLSTEDRTKILPNRVESAMISMYQDFLREALNLARNLNSTIDDLMAVHPMENPA